MKKNLFYKMRNAFFLLLFFLSSFSAYSQTAAFRSTYVFFNVEGNQKSYMLNNNPTDFVTPNFDGNNLGVFSSASIFQLKGAEHNVENVVVVTSVQLILIIEFIK